jgi:hypothetical protein
MVYNFTKEEWTLLGDMLGAVKHLQEELMAKGYGVICTFSTGIQKACITFIVMRNHVEIFSACILDVITHEDEVQKKIFERGQELLDTDLDAIEREALLARLAELDKKHNGGE